MHLHTAMLAARSPKFTIVLDTIAALIMDSARAMQQSFKQVRHAQYNIIWKTTIVIKDNYKKILSKFFTKKLLSLRLRKIYDFRGGEYEGNVINKNY